MTIYNFIIGNITVTIDISLFEETILADQVISPEDWLKGFANHVSAKVESHKQRIIDTEIAAVRKAGGLNQLPATDNAIVQALFDRPGYENRNQRENG